MEVFSSLLTELEVLDFTYVLCLDVAILPLKSILQLRNVSISSLSLRRIQSESRPQNYRPFWNLTSMFSVQFVRNITYLDLSRNAIQSIYGDFISRFPNLEILDISQNMLLFRSYYISYMDDKFYQGSILALPIMIHPHLRAIDIGRQDIRDEINTISTNQQLEYQLEPKTFNKETKNYDTSIFSSWLGNTHGNSTGMKCMRTFKMNDILINNTIFANVLNCILEDLSITDLPIPTAYIPSLLSIYEPSCFSNLRLPIATNLRVVRANHTVPLIGNAPALKPGQPIYSEQLFCSMKNEIRSFDFSNNFIPMDIYSMQFSGYESLQHLDIKQTGNIVMSKDFLRGLTNIQELHI